MSLSTGNIQAFQGELLTPLVSMQFESNRFATGAALMAAAGIAAVVRKQRAMQEIGETLVLPDSQMLPNPAAAPETVRRFKRQRLASLAAGVLGVVGLSSAAADIAGPFTEGQKSRVDSVAAIIGAGWESRAKDITDGEAPVPRIEAAINGINQLDGLGDVKITFIAAGSQPRSMGSIEDGNGYKEVVENFSKYDEDLSTHSSTNIAGALNVAEATEAGKILIFDGDILPAAAQLQGEEKPGQRRVSVIEMGQNGSKVSYFGSQREVVVNSSANTQLVGKEDIYHANSVEALQRHIKKIAEGQYVEIRREDYKGFEKLRNLALGALGALGVASQFLNIRSGRKGKGDKS